VNYQYTDRTVTFVEGHNQYGPNSLSTHHVFVGDDGEDYLPVPGRVQMWTKLSEVKKERHNPAAFLAHAQKQTGRPVETHVMVDAYRATTQEQRTPGPVSEEARKRGEALRNPNIINYSEK
jgi:hypothetical protein